MASVESRLKKVLGGGYGGPSVGYQDSKFIIYEWYDAPVGYDILGSGTTFKEALDRYDDVLRLRAKHEKDKVKKKILLDSLSC